MESVSNEPNYMRSLYHILLDLKARCARKSTSLIEEAKQYIQEYEAACRDSNINTDYIAATDIVLDAFRKLKSQA
jgi:hypothetical protein